MTSIKQLAIRGTFWTVAGYGASYIIRFCSNIVLTRLLAPEVFGLMGLVYVFITGMHMFSDIGIHTSVLQNKRGGERTFQKTAWTLQVMRSVVLWAGCCLIAFPIAHFYGNSQLLFLLPAVGVTTFVSGFYSTSLYNLGRGMEVKKIAQFDLLGQIVGVVTTISVAYFYPTVWALVIGSVISSIVQMLWSHRLAIANKQPDGFLLDRDSMREIVSFGKWIFISTILTFFATQSDRLMLGKLLPLEVLGVYGIAFTLADIPKQVVMAIGSKVVFPTYTKLVDLPRLEFRSKIKKLRRLILVGAVVGLALMISFGDIVISILYDNRYQDAAWMLPIIAIGLWPIMLSSTLEGALYALGNPRFVVLGNFFSFVFMASGIWLGFQIWGVPGAVMAVAASNIPPYLCSLYGLSREGLACIRQDIQATLSLVGLVLLLVYGRYLVGLPLTLPNF
ncbi:MAG: oligosaccharide flippase family protein [Oculatellaceae cyanobacterium Prado106]|jgi:O-antigen/teichoic acid export membrane protein|nr:oligosaccharide flippase family protein [Oculatellaceae cyanobacterium Prado106]